MYNSTHRHDVTVRFHALYCFQSEHNLLAIFNENLMVGVHQRVQKIEEKQVLFKQKNQWKPEQLDYLVEKL